MILQILEAQEVALKRGLYNNADSNTRSSDHLYQDLNQLLSPERRMSKDTLVNANQMLTEESPSEKAKINKQMLFPGASGGYHA